MTRDEHLEWAKSRAREYLKNNDWQQAWASMISDLREHPQLQDHKAIEMGMLLLMMPGSNYTNTQAMTKFIEGFN